MSSFYRSDVGRTIRDSKGEDKSAMSVLESGKGAKRVTHQSAVIGNKAFDNTLQINGHVADKVNSYYIKYAVSRAEIKPLLKAMRKVPVISKLTEEPDAICVISPRQVYDNFISSKVVGRLGLTTRSDTVMVKSIVWDSKRFVSTGGFVDLSFPVPGSDAGVGRRLYVLDDPPFDTLLANPATRFHSVSSQKALLR
ncbi:hypothetical protein J4E90_010811 [Alternaria incomplexa]|uniref:uncharacterized protein n=1 Tax=Alternaria incomplexa TaxID=1187928 RepID=UPI002221156A|nr:uncharacterized protein J4E90_010811 [Alternaria incomplexa]KAI4906138.1 hypothetical protein J4E90_010811 [Alternaria incomplexa]